MKQKLNPNDWRGYGFNQQHAVDEIVNCYYLIPQPPSSLTCQQRFRNTISEWAQQGKMIQSRKYFAMLMCAHDVYPELYDTQGYSVGIYYGPRDKLCGKATQYSQCLYQYDPDDLSAPGQMEMQNQYQQNVSLYLQT